MPADRWIVDAILAVLWFLLGAFVAGSVGFALGKRSVLKGRWWR
jgi:hypothetical protein